MPTVYFISRVVKGSNTDKELRHDYADASSHRHSTNSINRAA